MAVARSDDARPGWTAGESPAIRPDAHPAEADVVLRGVTVQYGANRAVDNLDLAVGRGELLSLLGPSGCGKTTTLRVIAGFVRPSAGQVLVKGRDVGPIPPYRRNIGVVFQSYALFPHKTVFDNVAFGLRMRRAGRDQIQRAVGEITRVVRLEGFEGRYPGQLSGGQQQRVALARALVFRPEVLLLDEPLSNLDEKLRQEMRGEIRRVQQELGITAIFVTHDQGEALALSDRVAVMNDGRIEQVGSAREVYEAPASRFAAEFIGAAVVLPGRLDGPDAFVTDDGLRIAVRPEVAGATPAARWIALRPEAIQVNPLAEPALENRAQGVVRSVTYGGATTELVVEARPGGVLPVEAPSAVAVALRPGADVRLGWPAAAGRLLDR